MDKKAAAFLLFFISGFVAGTAGVSADQTEDMDTEDFYSMPVPDDVFERMDGNSYKDDCPVPREDLRYLHVLHKNIDGEILEGELVCSEIIADDLVEIFQKLYEGGYPIERIRLVDDYDADDEKSMEDNNSSCFNYRTITGTDRISKHGLGAAVDINPFYNPYARPADGSGIIQPEGAEQYLDRSGDFPYKIEEGDLCWQLFTEHGFVWGGSWTSRKDYQHFEMPDSALED